MGEGLDGRTNEYGVSGRQRKPDVGTDGASLGWPRRTFWHRVGGPALSCQVTAPRGSGEGGRLAAADPRRVGR